MTNDLDNFDPHAWHDHGIVKAVKPARRRLKKRARGVALAATFGFFSTGLALPVDLAINDMGTCVAKPSGMLAARPEFSADYIDPEEWGKLVVLFSRLPRDESREPGDPDPLI